MDIFRLQRDIADDMSQVEAAIEGRLKEVWTALPAIVASDSDGHTMSAQSAVKLIVTLIDGTKQMVQMDTFDAAPVHYPGGGGVSHTHPVKKGDEGVVVFLSRPQDLWWQNGGVQNPIDGRIHHLADARWIPGGRSNPRKLSPTPSTTSQQNRSDDGNHVVDVHPQNGLTSTSTKKALTQVGGSGSNGAGTLHLPAKILKNAAKVLINCIQQDPLPPPGASLANRKAIATTPIGAIGSSASGIAGIMSGIFTGGASSIFANPIATQSSGLVGGITSAVSALGSVSGASGLISALSGGLSGALTTLTTGAGNLSGATTPSGGAFGLSDLLSHAQNLTQFFGSETVPGAVALSAATAPLQSGSTIAGIEASLATLISQVVAGSTSPGAATAQVNTWTSQLSGLMSGSNFAISSLQNAAPVMNLALAMASAAAGLDPNEQVVAGAVSTPNLAALTQLVADLFALSGDDLASATAFPDQAATQMGATGGM